MSLIMARFNSRLASAEVGKRGQSSSLRCRSRGGSSRIRRSSQQDSPCRSAIISQLCRETVACESSRLETSGRDASLAVFEGVDGKGRWPALLLDAGEAVDDHGPTRADGTSARAAVCAICCRKWIGRPRRFAWWRSRLGPARSPACGSASPRPRRWPTPSARK